ncbi:hypothetical protein ACVMH6_005008 [Rhizobium leguminosarum]
MGFHRNDRNRTFGSYPKFIVSFGTTEAFLNVEFSFNYCQVTPGLTRGDGLSVIRSSPFLPLGFTGDDPQGSAAFAGDPPSCVQTSPPSVVFAWSSDGYAVCHPCRDRHNRRAAAQTMLLPASLLITCALTNMIATAASTSSAHVATATYIATSNRSDRSADPACPEDGHRPKFRLNVLGFCKIAHFTIDF